VLTGSGYLTYKMNPEDVCTAAAAVAAPSTVTTPAPAKNVPNFLANDLFFDCDGSFYEKNEVRIKIAPAITA